MKKLLLIMFIVLLLMMAFAGPVFAKPVAESGRACAALADNVPQNMISPGRDALRDVRAKLGC